MSKTSHRSERPEIMNGSQSYQTTVEVWDLPTRIFHWALFFFVIVSFISGKTGGNAMKYHELSGFILLGLLVFRVFWGFIGSQTSRFSGFLSSPKTVMRYAGTLFRKDAPRHPGHNPMGGWSVMAMLVVLLIQAVTGLFATDDIFTQGPLYPYVSDTASRRLTAIHTTNPYLLVVLVTLHIAAVLFYLLYKKENLIASMLTGRKTFIGMAQNVARRPLWLAAVVAAVSALAVYFVVR